MPTYTYRRADGSTFEIEQRITEDALDTCPTTGQPVTRVITAGAGLVFKGSGFYLTDYARRNSSPSTAPETSRNGNSTNGSEDKPASVPAENSAGEKKDG